MAYRDLFKEVLHDELIEAIRTTTLSALALGEEKLKREMEALTGQSLSAGKRGRPTGASSVYPLLWLFAESLAEGNPLDLPVQG